MSAGAASEPMPAADRRKGRSARRRARLAAVQALYQVALVGADPARVVLEFAERARETGAMDAEFFERLVRGAADARERLDGLIAAQLAEDWRLDRLALTALALLRAAAFELDRCPDVPAPVVVSEYVDIARGFFDLAETGFVNGVLDRLARRLRAGELAGTGPGEGDGGPSG